MTRLFIDGFSSSVFFTSHAAILGIEPTTLVTAAYFRRCVYSGQKRHPEWSWSMLRSWLSELVCGDD